MFNSRLLFRVASGVDDGRGIYVRAEVNKLAGGGNAVVVKAHVGCRDTCGRRTRGAITSKSRLTR